MEKKIFVKDLELHKEIQSLFQILEVDLKRTRNGDYFIAMTVGDKTGKIPLRIWSASEDLFRIFLVGELIALKGVKVSEYQGNLQFSINRDQQDRIEQVPFHQCNPEDFLEVTKKDPEAMIREIEEVIQEIEKKPLQKLLLTFFNDKEFVTGFTMSPASISHHHIYAGGLLEHTSAVLKLCRNIANNYQVHRDLLLTGAIIHDIGKIKCYTFNPTIQMTTEGRLFSHISLGIKMLQQKMEETPLLLSKEDNFRLQHMVLSHHGKKEWGSPVEPATLEAVILHHADYLDAQAKKYQEAFFQGFSNLGEWTNYYPQLGTRLFLGLKGEGEE